ncbi:MAG: exopolysaccharide Pel transporter PelG, partial [Zoogloea sp.]|nr:exopolysaccharide Pel transporter PelG [Zoogloea sp.]
MAGIGFELRKLLKKDSILGIAQAYAYSAVIGSGPLVLSIAGLLLVGLLAQPLTDPALPVSQFQVSVTWLIAVSLIVTGGVQLAFTRFASDRLFEERGDKVLSNLNGVLLLTFACAGGLGLVLAFTLFAGQPAVYRLMMLAGFVLLCGIWITTILLSGLKHYKAILAIYAASYTIVVAAALLGRPWGLEGLLGGFVLGNGVLLAGSWFILARHYRSPLPLAFDFARPGACHLSLLAIGLLYNLAVWADKLMFWLWPWTSAEVIGPLRASVIYDLPVFMAYLFTIPGMAVFLVRIETDFVEHYDRFFSAVRRGGSLPAIEAMRDEMVGSIRQGLAEIAKVQTLTLLLAMALSGML